MKRLLLTSLALATTLPSVGTAQTGLPGTRLVDSGTVVRLHLQGGSSEVGKLETALQPSSTVIRYCPYPAPPCSDDGPPVTERASGDVVSIDAQRGTEAARGALLGAGAGMGLLALGSIVWQGGASDGGSQMSAGVRLFAVATVIAVPAVIGMLAGSKRSKWEQVR